MYGVAYHINHLSEAILISSQNILFVQSNNINFKLS